jgi:hypothetical protein
VRHAGEQLHPQVEDCASAQEVSHRFLVHAILLSSGEAQRSGGL